MDIINIQEIIWQPGIYRLSWHGERGGREVEWESGTVLQAWNDERGQRWGSRNGKEGVI